MMIEDCYVFDLNGNEVIVCYDESKCTEYDVVSGVVIYYYSADLTMISRYIRYLIRKYDLLYIKLTFKENKELGYVSVQNLGDFWMKFLYDHPIKKFTNLNIHFQKMYMNSYSQRISSTNGN